ncbi:MAG: hypothetical protein JWM86_2067 [Thermoleophilia bacterium]|nr:hypothetical protein [Thermoleophilia bacterium]
MLELVFKGVVAGVLVVAATEASRRSTAAAAILVSLPITSIIALAVLWNDTRDEQQVMELSWAILWIVLPSVVLFVALPLLMRAGLHFWLALPAACLVMAGAYFGYAKLLARTGLG